MFKSIVLLLVQFPSIFSCIDVSKVPFYAELDYLTVKSVKTNSKEKDLQMTKKGRKKKSKVGGVDSYTDIISDTRIETIFKDTKAVTGISPDFKWGELYQMI